LITPEMIDAWIRQVEENPASAPVMIEFIARRLVDLTRRNEALLAENIALRLEHKVEEYENRIADLEYQIDLLKRQLGGLSPLPEKTEASPGLEAVPCLLVYQPTGEVLRLVATEEMFGAGERLSLLLENLPETSLSRIRLLAASSREELLFVFSSGRAQALPVQSIPLAEHNVVNWQHAFQVDLNGIEELSTALPVARMSLFELCIQVSRRGCVKKLQEAFFESCVRKGYIGTGVKLPNDQTCSLVLAKQDDLIVLVSRYGTVRCLKAGSLPFTIEEAVNIGPLDHIVSAFNATARESLLFITSNGKALFREASWLEPAASLKVQAQSILSKNRLETGVKVIGAAAVNEPDWGIALDRTGQLHVFRVAELLAAGALPEVTSEIVDIAVFTGGQSMK